MDMNFSARSLSARNWRFIAVLAAMAMALVMSAPAMAQNGEKRDSVGQDAVDAVTQPLSDLNIIAKDIPPILLAAQSDPYGLEGLLECRALRTEIATLEDVLGPDADVAQEEGNLANSALRAGGNFIGGFIPFRGVVRQLSGANERRREMEAAVFSGVARRSFLKGYAMGLGCESREDAAISSAEDVLGLSGR